MTTTARPSSSAVPPSLPLVYTIASSTPHSGEYVPENILIDKPQDQRSRWSGASHGNTTDQWIILRLESVSVLEKITFGKFFKPHPCNAKEIKVFAGITKDHMSEVLHVALKNDTTPETFNVEYVNSAGICTPVQFIKLMPMLPHGQNFHVSIWHIAVYGITDSNYLEEDVPLFPRDSDIQWFLRGKIPIRHDAYHINTGVAKDIFSSFSGAGGPDACFTQGVVIDSDLKELYV